MSDENEDQGGRSRRPFTRRAKESRATWGFVGVVGGALSVILGFGALGSCLGIAPYGELQTKALAAEQHTVINTRVDKVEADVKNLQTEHKALLKGMDGKLDILLKKKGK
jgi:hypothetical protein